MGKETGMLHVTPRARNGQRAKVAAKGVWSQDGSEWDNKPTHTPVAQACRMTYQPARGAVSRQNRRRRTPVYALSSLCAGSNEEARADKEEDRDTRQSGGREKVHVREKGRGKGKEQRSRERDKGKPADEQGARTGEGTRRAHGEHNTARRHRRGEHRRTKGRAAPRTTTRTAQTPHTPHTPNEPRQPAQQWAGI